MKKMCFRWTFFVHRVIIIVYRPKYGIHYECIQAGAKEKKSEVPVYGFDLVIMLIETGRGCSGNKGVEHG